MRRPHSFQAHAIRGVYWASIILMAITSTAASQRAPTSYKSYARRIIQHSDSAMTISNEYFTFLTNAIKTDQQNSSDFATRSAAYTEIAATSAQYASRIRKKAGDFDAISPPANYERVHMQILEALRSTEQNINQLAKAFAYASCAEEHREQISCYQGERAEAGFKLLMSVVRQQAQVFTDYTEARSRAAGLLAERHIKLPDFP